MAEHQPIIKTAASGLERRRGGAFRNGCPDGIGHSGVAERLPQGRPLHDGTIRDFPAGGHIAGAATPGHDGLSGGGIRATT
jgi:hypothetical protein